MKWLITIGVICMTTFCAFGQKGYEKDSLQIKLYAEIRYEDKISKSIDVTKVFCDYCTDKQINFIKQEGWHRAYQERYLPQNRLVKGLRKLTIIIRISKEDFKRLRDVQN